MGRKLVLTGTKLTDTRAPRLPDVDPIESTGSLLLMDFTHPSRTAHTAVGQGVVVPNLMADNFRRLMPTAATVDSTMSIASAMTDPGTPHLVEQTARGGLHVIMSQTAAIASGTGMKINAGTDVRSYIKSRDGNPIYASVWGNITRPPKSLLNNANAVEDNVYFEIGNGSNSSQLAIMRHNDSGFSGGGNTIIGKYPGPLGFATGPKRLSFAAQGASTASTGIPNNVHVAFGPFAGAYNNAVQSWRDRSVFPSWVCYRVYVEDLGVSGRSYAEVEALDAELYAAEVLTPGGRYYGDTFTDPATKP